MEHYAYIHIEAEELNSIMKRLDAAKEEIYNCYADLQKLGIIVISAATRDGDKD